MFNGIINHIKGIFRNEKGQGMVEYILIVLLIAIVAYVAFSNIGDTILNEGNNAANDISNAASYLFMLY